MSATDAIFVGPSGDSFKYKCIETAAIRSLVDELSLSSSFLPKVFVFQWFWFC